MHSRVLVAMRPIYTSGLPTILFKIAQCTGGGSTEGAPPTENRRTWSILNSPQVLFHWILTANTFQGGRNTRTGTGRGLVCNPASFNTCTQESEGTNVAANLRASGWIVGSRPPTLPGTNDFDDSSRIAVRAIAAESNRSHRELSAAAMRDRYLHHRSVCGHNRGVWNGSIAGVARKRHRTGI